MNFTALEALVDRLKELEKEKSAQEKLECRDAIFVDAKTFSTLRIRINDSIRHHVAKYIPGIKDISALFDQAEKSYDYNDLKMKCEEASKSIGSLGQRIFDLEEKNRCLEERLKKAEENAIDQKEITKIRSSLDSHEDKIKKIAEWKYNATRRWKRKDAQASDGDSPGEQIKKKFCKLTMEQRRKGGIAAQAKKKLSQSPDSEKLEKPVHEFTDEERARAARSARRSGKAHILTTEERQRGGRTTGMRKRKFYEVTTLTDEVVMEGSLTPEAESTTESPATGSPANSDEIDALAEENDFLADELFDQIISY